MGVIWRWLLKHGEIVVRAGELVIEVGKAVKDSFKEKPKA